MSKTKPFSFRLPVSKIDSNNDRPYLVGHVEVDAIAQLFNDGTLRTIDINTLTWLYGADVSGTDVTTYVKYCQPDMWEQIEAAALNAYQNVAIEKSSDNNSGGL